VSAHSFEEGLHTWSDQDIDLTNLSLDFNWKYNICVFNRLELGMNQGFIKVENQSLSTDILLSLWADQPFFVVVIWLSLLLLLLLTGHHLGSIGSLGNLSDQ
jgi:hypothetical protein